MIAALEVGSEVAGYMGTMVQRKNLGSMIAALNVVHTMGSTLMDCIRIN
jgi:hypothetical protein